VGVWINLRVPSTNIIDPEINDYVNLQ
jgi:hypothetical protein